MTFLTETYLRSQLSELPAIDPNEIDSLAARLMAPRSLSREARVRALDTAIGLVDLTSLEAFDTPDKIRQLALRAASPDPSSNCPPTAAVCVFGDLAEVARDALREVGSGVRVASVAGGFPHGRMSLATKLLDVKDAMVAGAQEIDMVLDRGALIDGRLIKVADEISTIVSACHARGVLVKVILETGELGSYDMVNQAAWLAMLAGADFIKTSTGKSPVSATPGTATILLQAAKDFRDRTGRFVGVKPSGGIRTADQALAHLVLASEVAGSEWLKPELYRFGASALLADLVAQRQAALNGDVSAISLLADGSSY